jgi:hypothetical protein
MKKIIILFRELFYIYKDMVLQITWAGKYLAKPSATEVVATQQQWLDCFMSLPTRIPHRPCMFVKCLALYLFAVWSVGWHTKETERVIPFRNSGNISTEVVPHKWIVMEGISFSNSSIEQSPSEVIVAQLVKKSPASCGTLISLLCSNEPTTDSYFEPNKFLNFHFI